MRKPVTIALLLTLCSVTLLAQTGSWRTYMAYYEPQQIVKLNNLLYVRASNGLYSYNLNDQSITTFDKISQLNDTYITRIARNDETKKLLVVYQNQNMDVIDSNGEVDNISALYLKSMTGDKTINNIFMDGRFAYLACGFGIVKVNMKKVEVSESYILGDNITDVAVKGDSIYAHIVSTWTENNGTPVIPYQYEGDIWTFIENWNPTHEVNTYIASALTDNLIDPHNWHLTTQVPEGIFNEDLSDWNQYQELVATLKPGGPKYNYFQFMRFKHDRLYTCGGGIIASNDLQRPGTIQVLKNNDWTIYQDNVAELTGWKYIDVENIDADPNDPEHVFAGSRTGLYEFQEGQFVKAYNIDNSPLKSAVSPANPTYVQIKGLCYDKQGTLWLFNSSNTALESIWEFSDGQFTSHAKEELINGTKSIKEMRWPIEDSRGYIWFVNENWELPSFYCYDPKTDKIIQSFTTITNQDGTTYSTYTPTCVAEDMEGNIWIGTTDGPFVVEKDNIGQPNANVLQIKVPRNDGTNLADYLMASAHINTMVIDGAGRKWFGTLDNGVYCISADNMTQLHHFTTDNSPLISNGVNSLAINNDTGELFIGTDMGLCSYITDATTAVETMQKDQCYAFPNPVVAGYEGLITVRGFTLDSDVKILSASGKLIAQGRSNGGTFTWDGRDSQGRRVASGVYMVAAATNDGKKGTVCKIAVIK